MSTTHSIPLPTLAAIENGQWLVYRRCIKFQSRDDATWRNCVKLEEDVNNLVRQPTEQTPTSIGLWCVMHSILEKTDWTNSKEFKPFRLPLHADRIAKRAVPRIRRDADAAFGRLMLWYPIPNVHLPATECQE